MYDVLEKFKSLANVGRIESEEIPLHEGEITVKLRVISSKEELEIHERCVGLEGFPYLFMLRKETLARSICVINGIPTKSIKYIEITDPDTDEKISLEPPAYFSRMIDEWTPTLVDYLYRHYEILMSQSDLDIIKDIPEESRLHRKEIALLEKVLKKLEKETPKDSE
jgi:hypothetical protein